MALLFYIKQTFHIMFKIIIKITGYKLQLIYYDLCIIGIYIDPIHSLDYTLYNKTKTIFKMFYMCIIFLKLSVKRQNKKKY